jgi:hypothetical protein
MSEYELNDNEKINDDMFQIFGKAAMIFIDVLKKGYSDISKNQKYEKSIINKHFNDYKRDIELFIDKVKRHHGGERVEYDLSEISLLSAIIYIFHKQTDANTQIIGYIFNNDARYSSIFEDTNDDNEKQKISLHLFENLVRSMSKRIF